MCRSFIEGCFSAAVKTTGDAFSLDTRLGQGADVFLPAQPDINLEGDQRLVFYQVQASLSFKNFTRLQSAY